MFLGHFALGLAVKKVESKISLGVLFLSVQFLDLLWPTLLLNGVERVEITTDPSAPMPLRFVHYPVSHSLLMALVWGVLIGVLYWMARKDGRSALVVGLCVLSHWVLDLLVHVPDLPLYPGNSPLVGLGLWHYKILVLLIESGMFAVGAYLYLGVTKPKNKIGMYAIWGLLIFLFGIHLANIFGPPPTDVSTIAWGAQFQWLIVLWAFWADRNRE